jgi:hypothetical protein
VIGSGGSCVLVDHATEDSCTPYRRVDRDDHVRLVIGRVLVEALVWTVVVEMALEGAEHHTSVSLVVDQHPVGALGSDAANEPFRVTVRARRPGWRLDDLDVLSGEYRVERSGELGVSIPDQVKAPG